jgi:hypothetical protein
LPLSSPVAFRRTPHFQGRADGAVYLICQPTQAPPSAKHHAEIKCLLHMVIALIRVAGILGDLDGLADGFSA